MNEISAQKKIREKMHTHTHLVVHASGPPLEWQNKLEEGLIQ